MASLMTPPFALRPVINIGRAVRFRFAHIGNITNLVWAVLARASNLGSHNIRMITKTTLNQIRFGGLHAIPLIAALAVLIGGVAIIEAFSILSGLADDLIGSLLVGVVLRELAPLVTAVVFIGRSGTAMATEIGSMRLNGEVDALIAHRIDPIAFIVLPRVIASIVCIYILTVVFNLVGILGGAGAALLLKNISFSILIGKIASAFSNAEIILFLIKGGLFGTVIGVLSCYFGLRVTYSRTELPRAVTKAAVGSLVWIFALDGFLALIHYLIT